MLQKLGEEPTEKFYYQLFEKLLLKRLETFMDRENLIPDHQFDLMQRHSTMERLHRIVDVAMEQKRIEEKSKN